MNEIAVKVSGLSKVYQLGAVQENYRTFRDKMAGLFSIKTNRKSEKIWALRNISFEVQKGEVVGVIGSNGAGKSTLLKILSRITEPTEGEAEIYGRVGSLLEVGTGFHPELTGRENIYLNGIILGMKKSEIKRHFDSIVDFSEIEKFIDTPVKHYSSGMYIRLAFAVAAHLESEILLVDEVLSVGDASFQGKCLSKMNDVVKCGRTILFVSHNMQAIQSLCQRVLLIERGQVQLFENSQSVVAHYLSRISGNRAEKEWPAESAPGNHELKLLRLKVCSEDRVVKGVFSSRKKIFVELKFVSRTSHSALCVGFDLLTPEGIVVARSYQTDSHPDSWPPVKIGENIWACAIPEGFLNAGIYQIAPRIGLHNINWIVRQDPVLQFEVVLDHGVSPFWNSLNAKSRPGVTAPIFQWTGS